MENKMEKLFAKKKGKEMTDNEKDAKMSVVSALRDFAAGEMGKKVSGLKKADPESFKKDEPFEQKDESEADEAEEEAPHAEGEDLSEEEIDAKLEELMALKAKMKA